MAVRADKVIFRVASPAVLVALLVACLVAAAGCDDSSVGVAGPGADTTLDGNAADSRERDVGDADDATTGQDASRVDASDAVADAIEDDASADAPDGAADGASSDAAGDSAPDSASDAAPDGAGEDASGDAVADVDGAGDTGTVDSGEVFDLALIRDRSTIDCRFENHRTALKDGVLVDAWDVQYTSYEVIDGALRPITIRAFASKPASASGPMPGVVQAHGLGGHANEQNATGLASLLGMYTLAFTGPGGGTEPSNTSEGLPSGHADGYRMFDTLVDPRGSWFWGHAMAAMRGLTCLETRPEVDASRLGMTGYSAGGVVTLISSAVDDRIVAAMPLSGTGGWGEAVRSPNAWQHALLTAAGLTVDSEEWRILLEHLDSSRLLGETSTRIFMMNGTTDEFFPLTAHLATYDAIAPEHRRTTLAANLDHGCFSFTGLEDASAIEERAETRIKGGQRMWFHHWFGTDPNYATLPAEPVVEAAVVGAATAITAVVDGGGSQLDVEEVRFWWSVDGALVFTSVELDRASAGVWTKLVPAPLPADAVYYVDVEYRVDELFSSERFSLSSRPRIPAGLVPRIRSITSCIP